MKSNEKGKENERKEKKNSGECSKWRVEIRGERVKVPPPPDSIPF